MQQNYLQVRKFEIASKGFNFGALNLTENIMKKLIALLLTAMSFGVFATTYTPAPTVGVTSVMTGTIGVGTSIAAGIGQSQTQTSIGSLTGSAVIANPTTTPSLTSSIVGTASSVTSGTGYSSPSFLLTQGSSTVGVSAVTSGAVTSTLTGIVIPTTTISVPHNN